MIFEWDPEKNRQNTIKHGVTFEQALQIWTGSHIEVKDIAYAKDETRSATLGLIDNRLYVAIWTKRNDRTRLITVRRARKNEEEIYREKI